MTTLRWTHDTTVTVIVGPEGGEDSIDFDVRLYVNGSPATDDYFDKDFGNWLPGDPEEIELEGFEIRKRGKCTVCLGRCTVAHGDGTIHKCHRCRGTGAVETLRKPVEAFYPDANDQAVIDAVDSWFADRGEECWESLEQDDGE